MERDLARCHRRRSTPMPRSREVHRSWNSSAGPITACRGKPVAHLLRRPPPRGRRARSCLVEQLGRGVLGGPDPTLVHVQRHRHRLAFDLGQANEQLAHGLDQRLEGGARLRMVIDRERRRAAVAGGISGHLAGQADQELVKRSGCIVPCSAQTQDLRPGPIDRAPAPAGRGPRRCRGPAGSGCSRRVRAAMLSSLPSSSARKSGNAGWTS